MELADVSCDILLPVIVAIHWTMEWSLDSCAFSLKSVMNNPFSKRDGIMESLPYLIAQSYRYDFIKECLYKKSLKMDLTFCIYPSFLMPYFLVARNLPFLYFCMCIQWI